MKQVIAAVSLVLASGSAMATGLSHGNVDLDGWVVEHQPAASAARIDANSGPLSRGNIDLFGWVVENRSATGAVAAMSGDGHIIGRDNVDLDHWIVSDAMAE